MTGIDVNKTFLSDPDKFNPHGITDSRQNRFRRLILGFWLSILVASFIAHIYTIRSFPIIRNVDEPGLLAMADAFPRTHRFESPIFGGLLPTHAREPRFYLVMIAWLQIFGTNWISGRVFFFCVGMILLATIFLVGRRLNGYAAGLYAAAFTSCTLIFFMTSHEIRLDIVFAVAVIVTLMAHLEADRRDNWWFHFLTGALLILTYEAHGNAIALVLAFGIYYLIRYLPSTLKRRRLAPWGILIGGIAGSCVLALIHVVPSIQDLQKSFAFSLAERRMPILGWLSPGEMINNFFRDGLLNYWSDAPTEVLICLALLIWGIINKQTRRFALLYLLFQIMSILLIPIYRPVYFVNGMPFLSLIAAALVAKGKNYQFRLILSSVLLVMICFSTLDQLIPTATENWNTRFIEQAKQLRKEIPSGATVISSPILLLGLGLDRQVIDIGMRKGFLRSWPEKEIINKINPGYIVFFPKEGPRWHSAQYGAIDHVAEGSFLKAFYGKRFLYPGVNGKIVGYHLERP